MEMNSSAIELNRARTDTTISRRVIASFPNYTDAQRAVDWLADQHFAVSHLSIVAHGLQFVEQVTGRLTWGKALLNGALGGAMTGFFVGFLLGLLLITAPFGTAFVSALYGIIVGAVIGLIISAVAYGLSGHHRDFTSVGTLQADRYDVVADETVADEAARLLAQQRTV